MRKEFNLEDYHTGRYDVVTRDGCKVRILATDLKHKRPIVCAYTDKDNNEYECHPLTGYRFDGFQIPNFEIVKKTVLEAALVNPNIHVVGWDVAVTEDGCTFIEGNRRPGFDLVQVLYNKGKKDIMRYCLNIINEKEITNYKV